MANTNLEDREIIEKVKRGDYRALDGFYLENKLPYLKWAVNHYKISETEIEDLYHDAFEALVKKIVLGKLDDLHFTLKSYFFGISKHLIFQRFRQTKVYDLKEDNLPEDDFESILPDIEEEKLQVIIDCKKDLSSGCQSILDMYYNEDKSMREISVLLGYKNEDVVKSQKLRCLNELRLCVKAKFAY